MLDQLSFVRLHFDCGRWLQPQPPLLQVENLERLVYGLRGLGDRNLLRFACTKDCWSRCNGGKLT